jgi:hypothetical protein
LGRYSAFCSPVPQCSSVLPRAAGSDPPEPVYFPLPGTGIDGLRVLFINDPDGFTVELVHGPGEHFAVSSHRSA